MSKSPHRLRGDAAECWTDILFGEIVRAIGGPVIVRASETIRLPRTGHWESGLGRVAPALDDSLGATAFAVAWRWACAEKEANAWPSLELIARKATDEPVESALICGLATARGIAITLGEAPHGGRSWRIDRASIAVSSEATVDWREVDRIGVIVRAWLSTAG